MSDASKPWLPLPPMGLTLRDYFAAHALADTTYVDSDVDASAVAKQAYQIADAMIYHREHNEPEV